MPTPSPSTEFELHARKAAIGIAQTFTTVAKAKQWKTWATSTAAMLCTIAPFAIGLAEPWLLALTVPPIILAKTLRDTRLKQKEMKEAFESVMDAVPAEARGIVNSELHMMEKTIKSFTTEFSKKDIVAKDQKRQLELLASGMLLFIAPPLAIPSFFYLLLKKESEKTTDLIRQADAVIERNRPPSPEQI